MILLAQPAYLIAQDSTSDIGIIEIRGGKAFISAGKTDGIARGDEYELQHGPEEAGGDNLLIIEEVKDEISVAAVIYSARALEIGFKLQPIEKAGLDSTLNAQVLFGTDGALGVLDFRESINRGFFTYRPFLGTQLIFVPHLDNENDPLDLLINLNVGGEINWFFWRIQIAPSLAGGIAMTVPLNSEESVHFSHAGGYVDVKVNYLINPKWKIGLAVGFASWIVLPEAPDDSYLGLTIGAGAALKY